MLAVPEGDDNRQMAFKLVIAVGRLEAVTRRFPGKYEIGAKDKPDSLQDWFCAKQTFEHLGRSSGRFRRRRCGAKRSARAAVRWLENCQHRPRDRAGGAEAARRIFRPFGSRQIFRRRSSRSLFVRSTICQFCVRALRRSSPAAPTASTSERCIAQLTATSAS